MDCHQIGIFSLSVSNDAFTKEEARFWRDQS